MSTTGKTQFEVGKSYGNESTVKVIKRTAKTITIESNAWGTMRVKIRDFYQNAEAISFKCWVIDATEAYDFETAKQLNWERSYN